MSKIKTFNYYGDIVAFLLGIVVIVSPVMAVTLAAFLIIALYGIYRCIF